MHIWRESTRPARLQEVVYKEDKKLIRCLLCPRHCTLAEDQLGFCKVRGNREGQLVTLNYGKAVHVAEECIETEAIFHYSPGERILSLGNIGCTLNCAYCQNWSTSQSRFVTDKHVHYYSPEDIVDIAVRHGIRVLSWTYNDPIVWQEFVVDTAKLAKEAGLINLYKSAFYISEMAVEELLPYIDIFSISIKSFDPEYYGKLTGGKLEPVLAATKMVHAAGKHVEISNLMITDISDDVGSAQNVASWVLNELGEDVPLHFVRFHPDYRMRNTERTPVSRLRAAREAALEKGLKHVYLGNVYEPEFSKTSCRDCGAVLVERYGLTTTIHDLDHSGCCAKCGTSADTKMMPQIDPVKCTPTLPDDGLVQKEFNWHGDINSLHVQVENPASEADEVYYRGRSQDGMIEPWKIVPVNGGESYRFIIAKSTESETGAEIALPASFKSNLFEIFDRAHFPTVPLEEESAGSDVSPLPIFQRASDRRQNA